MANLSISFSDSIRVFGLAPSTKWGAFTWGTDKWGEGLPNGVVKSFLKYMQNDQTSSDSVSKTPQKFISDSESVTAAQTNTAIRDGSGYAYIFPGPTSDAEESVHSEWEEVNGTDGTWTETTGSSTTWS